MHSSIGRLVLIRNVEWRRKYNWTKTNETVVRIGYWAAGPCCYNSSLNYNKQKQPNRRSRRRRKKIGKKRKRNKHLNHVSTYSACVTHLRFNLCCLVNGKRFNSFQLIALVWRQRFAFAHVFLLLIDLIWWQSWWKFIWNFDGGISVSYLYTNNDCNMQYVDILRIADMDFSCLHHVQFQ